MNDIFRKLPDDLQRTILAPGRRSQTVAPGAIVRRFTVALLSYDGRFKYRKGHWIERFAEPSGTSGSNLDRSKIGLERSGIVGVPKENP